jgi:hypothetical protein
LHIRVTTHQDHFAKQFPYTQASLFHESYADKEFLFHLILIPFLTIGETEGAKIATIVFSTLVILITYFVLNKRKVPIPVLFIFLFFASADLFLYRLSLARPHILSLFLTLYLCWALFENKRWLIAFLCAVFVLTYTAYHLVIGFALLYCLNKLFHTSKWNGMLLHFAIFGTFFGIFIHPHFPNNLLIWKVQNIDVLKLLWSGIDLGFADEIQPPDPRWFIINFTVAFFSLPIALFYCAWKKAEMKEDTTFFIFLAFGFLCLTMMSKRFAEYWPAYVILAVACLVRDAKLPLDWRYIFESPKNGENHNQFRTGRNVTIVFTIITAFFFVRTYTKALYLNSLEHEPYYREAALWMKEHVPDKETIFHGDWDDFPQLFYFNPDNYYLVCLDPIFMYAYDPNLWLKWRLIGRGESKHPDIEIKTLFNSRFAFFSIDFTDAIEQFRHHPKMTIGYEDEHCIVFQIHDEIRQKQNPREHYE